MFYLFENIVSGLTNFKKNVELKKTKNRRKRDKIIHQIIKQKK